MSVGTGLLFPHRYSSPVRGYFQLSLSYWRDILTGILTGTGLLSALSLLLEGYIPNLSPIEGLRQTLPYRFEKLVVRKREGTEALHPLLRALRKGIESRDLLPCFVFLGPDKPPPLGWLVAPIRHLALGKAPGMECYLFDEVSLS
jgi:hypothetical protein